MTQPVNLGPVRTDVRKAETVLDDLWTQAGVETRAYTGNIVALTEKKHLARVEEALAGLEGRYAGRQIIGVMDGDDSVQVEARLVPQRGGVYIERLTLDANPEQLRGAILPLLRPATLNHIWWASDDPPGGPLLAELADIADQVIADALTLGIPAAGRYALADLGWSRTASWREGLAQVFDAPDAALQIGRVERVHVTYAGEKDLPARLYAGWIASTLGWPDLSRITLASATNCGRENGDLCGVALEGDGVRFALETAGGDTVTCTCVLPSVERTTEMQVPGMTLAQGLARVMARPERGNVFERALKLALAGAQ
ncbi:glucose-6-phosphate dehydrogenase assembly protein OpcA [Deinococcus maricopensis]|uniref:Glucose-6-phosphate dehydrogenase subunit n=1 Tax=Deinococcus maricopensis (strain DSM 21211 / LMG 22137 / NRRL B-23946 / LB-34) TaxID=709986 RepID=E8UAC9_DEIML|nr:glucose-6-phosphate dehydrogenase assembly protein OpcA [Deinococcus maricopensis]ADV68018.1 Glucose-6-phosphate dehydrogenase subunit [Deinococcus maricopensis DSM 21211]